MNYSTIILNNIILKKIGEIADKLNLETYVVGGFVRDYLLGINSNDIDIVCIGSGIELAKEVAKEINVKTNLVIYKTFGTAMIKLKDGEVEFIGARKESYDINSRKPSVENGTLEDDQNRRDFTINSMAICLNQKKFGEFIDPFNGKKDLKDKIIKTPLDPNKTFSDDPLRILRAIRFATRFGFNIDERTFNSMKINIDRLEIVSKERIHSEVNKTMLSEQPSRGFLLYLKSGILRLVLPEMIALKGREIIDGHSHKDNFFHTLKVLDNVSQISDNLWLRWTALLHDIAKPITKRYDPNIGFTFHGHEELGAKMVPKIFKRLKLPLNENMNYVIKLVRLHLRPIALVNNTVTESAIRRLIYEAGDDIEDLLKLCRADITSENPHKVERYLQNFDIVEKKIKKVEERDQIRNLQPVITGQMIMKTFGLKPSKIIGEIKNEIKEAILEGAIRNEFNQAYNYMIKIAEKKSLKPTKNN